MVFDLDVFEAYMFRIMFRELVHIIKFLKELKFHYYNRFTAEVPGFIRFYQASAVIYRELLSRPLFWVLLEWINIIFSHMKLFLMVIH